MLVVIQALDENGAPVTLQADAQGRLLIGDDGNLRVGGIPVSEEVRVPVRQVALVDGVDSLQSNTYKYNGATFDRVRNNVEGVALISAARTLLTNSADITNYNNRILQVYLNVTATAAGTGGLTVVIQAKDPASGTYKTINSAPTAVVATGITVYQIGAGATNNNAAGVVQMSSAAVPRTFRIQVQVGDATSYTYSVGYALLG